MNKKQALYILEKYQKWRLSDTYDIELLNPSKITEALNVAIEELKKAEQRTKVKRKK